MTRMTQRNNSISGLARLVRTTALGVAIATSTSSAGQPAADRFVAGNPASLKRAEELGLRHLREAPTLLAGVELGRARSVEIDALGRAHIRVAQTVAGVPVFGAEGIVHLDAGGRFAGLTDGFARNIAADIRPAIDPATALSTAIATAAPSVPQPGSTVDLQFLRRSGKDWLIYRVQLDYVEGGDAVPAGRVRRCHRRRGGVELRQPPGRPQPPRLRRQQQHVAARAARTFRGRRGQRRCRHRGQLRPHGLDLRLLPGAVRARLVRQRRRDAHQLGALQHQLLQRVLERHPVGLRRRRRRELRAAIRARWT